MPPKSPPFYKKKVKMGGFFRAVLSPRTPVLERTALQMSQEQEEEQEPEEQGAGAR